MICVATYLLFMKLLQLEKSVLVSGDSWPIF